MNFIFVKRLWQIDSFSFWLGLWLFGLSALFCYVIRYWQGDHLFPVHLTNYLMPWLLIVLIPGFILAGLVNQKWLTVTLLAPTILICFIYTPLFLPNLNNNNDSLASLKVMSYNVWRDYQNTNAVADGILQEQPDILLLQELKPERLEKLIGAFGNLYSNHSLYFDYQQNML